MSAFLSLLSLLRILNLNCVAATTPSELLNEPRTYFCVDRMKINCPLRQRKPSTVLVVVVTLWSGRHSSSPGPVNSFFSSDKFSLIVLFSTLKGRPIDASKTLG